MWFICWFRYLSPCIFHFWDKFLFQSLRILFLFHKISNNKNNLFRLLISEKLKVELQNNLKNFQLRPFECTNLLNPDIDDECMWDSKSKQWIFTFNFLNAYILTVLYYRSLESLPSTSRITMLVNESTLNQIPFVVWPTLCFRFKTSKSVPNRQFSKVLLPELCEPMIDTIWYSLGLRRVVSFARF